MRLIAAQHHRPIKQLVVDIIDSEVCASLDTGGTVIVTSNASKLALLTNFWFRENNQQLYREN
jgi:hypothetical protein